MNAPVFYQAVGPVGVQGKVKITLSSGSFFTLANSPPCTVEVPQRKLVIIQNADAIREKSLISQAAKRCK